MRRVQELILSRLDINNMIITVSFVILTRVALVMKIKLCSPQYIIYYYMQSHAIANDLFSVQSGRKHLFYSVK